MNNIDKHFTDQLNIIQTSTLEVNQQETPNQALFVYLFDSNNISNDLAESLCKSYLHDNELPIFAKRKQPQAQREYLATRLLLKQHVSQHLAIPFAQLSVLFSDAEKQLQIYNGGERLPVSACISHSHGFVSVAITHTKVALGIDIEKIIPTRSLAKVAKRYYHEQELQACSINNETALYRIWTLKEALAKAIRQPIAKVLKKNVFDYSQQFDFCSGIVEGFDLSIMTNKDLISLYKVYLIVNLDITN